MKILLLGATGQLGLDIQKELVDHQITCLSSKTFDFSTNRNFEINENFDYVINCMAMTNTGLCEDEKEKAFKLNASRVGEISKVCHEKNIPFIHLSTDYVFDGKSRKGYTEQDPTGPLSVYGESKLQGEKLALENHNKVFIFRVSSLYGIGGNNFVKTILGKAKDLGEGQELTIVSDQFMSPTHTLDVARVIKHFIENQITDYGIYHASNKGVCSWFDFTNEILKLAGLENVLVKEVSYRDFPSKLERPEYSEMDTTKLSKYYQMPKWQESLSEFITLNGERK